MDELLSKALDAAASAGASYADVRAVDATSESLSVRERTVESLDRAESIGFGVRVLVDGAWGFACSAKLEGDEPDRIAATAIDVARASATATPEPVELAPEPVHEARWASPLEKDPFAVPLEDKVGLLASAT